MSMPGRDDESPLPWDVVIPDDISELDAEVQAFQREARRARRFRWARRMLTHRSRYGLPVPLAVLVLAAVAVAGSLLAVFGPRPSPGPSARPLARPQQATPGEVGGLLPVAQVVVRGVSRDVRDLRPAVLTLLPVGCGCAATVESIFRQAREYEVELYLVGDDKQSAELSKIASGTGNGSAAVVVDAAAVLAGAYMPHGVTAVLVNSAGVVTAVERDLGAGVRLEPSLAQLLRHGEGA